ncbi:MAG TPA: lysylphosphatidylglycerol synthase transmembrane domain-containing protein [Thermoanaerobaculia bacterium]|nr:lysylphosphatidylglycerol synthase transmembrane domain-containing protein [Thermoanaerobaculia bacterium]
MPVASAGAQGTDSETDAARRGFEHLGRRLLIPALLGVLACVGLALYADGRKVAARLAEFDLRLLAPILGLSLANYALRFVRWELYLKRLGLPLARGKSLGIFLVGFLLSVTPGKAGELGKAWLVRELGGGKARRAVPAVLAERATDLLGVFVLLGLGALPFRGGGWIAAACFVAVGAAVAVLTWERGAEALFRLAARIPAVGRRVGVLRGIYDDLRSLLSPGLLAAGLGVAVVAWGAEGIGFTLAVRQYAPQAGYLSGIFNYSVSTCAGSLSMLPGGLLAAEGSLAALLHSQGLDAAAAASATLIIRAATLWFAVLLGLLALPFVARWLAARTPKGDRIDR